MDPEGFLDEGYLDATLRRAIELGAPPEVAYQMVTLNVAEHFHLDHLIGSLAPGKMADILISPSPMEFSPQLSSDSWLLTSGFPLPLNADLAEMLAAFHKTECLFDFLEAENLMNDGV